MEKVTIIIEATAKGVDTIVMVDGNEVARQREVPRYGGCESQHPDFTDQIGDNNDLDELAEIMDDKFAFMGLDLLGIFID